jgi:hypothetical protein
MVLRKRDCFIDGWDINSSLAPSSTRIDFSSLALALVGVETRGENVSRALCCSTKPELERKLCVIFYGEMIQNEGIREGRGELI